MIKHIEMKFLIITLIGYLGIMHLPIIQASANYVEDTYDISDNTSYIEQNHRYGFTDDDIYLLTQLLCGDKSYSGDGEYDFSWYLENGKELNYEEIGKVLCVVMNRVRSDIYSDSVKEVVLQKGQFVVFPRNLKADPDEASIEVIREWCEKYDAWDDEIQIIPEDHLYFCAGPNGTNVTRADWR